MFSVCIQKSSLPIYCSLKECHEVVQCICLGVADGVGGWRHYGIDSSLFSSALMESCRRFVMEGGLETPSPISVIKAGFQELFEHKEPLFGR